MRVARWLPLLAVVLLSGLFAYLNGAERITLNLGLAILYQVRLVPVVFGAFVLGMIMMFLVGLRHDLRVRRLLRERRLLQEDYPPPEYRSSQDPYSPPDLHPPPDTS